MALDQGADEDDEDNDGGGKYARLQVRQLPKAGLTFSLHMGVREIRWLLRWHVQGKRLSLTSERPLN
eukprot:scaffold169173_cov18-Tisochrysis_lutea.AAC.3